MTLLPFSIAYGNAETLALYFTFLTIMAKL